MVLTYESSDELYHYGVKGMKWGVRKFRKESGSYTRKGLKNFDESYSKYSASKAKRKSDKAAYKSGAITKAQYKDSKNQVKRDKKQLDEDYDQLKYDHRADKGKELYKRGKTITGGTKVAAVSQVGIAVGANIARALIAEKVGDERVANIASSAIFIGGTAANAMIAGKTWSNNRNLRAYYSHSRNRPSNNG